jgi:hypothetical protein
MQIEKPPRFGCEYSEDFYQRFFDAVEAHKLSLGNSLRIALSNIKDATPHDVERIYKDVSYKAIDSRSGGLVVEISDFVVDTSGLQFGFIFGANSSSGDTIPMALVASDGSIVIKNPSGRKK